MKKIDFFSIFPKFQNTVTLRKINIFRWDFFKTISTRSENAISGLTSDIPASWREISTNKVVKQNFPKYFLKKQDFSVFRLFSIPRNAFLSSEMHENTSNIFEKSRKPHKKIWKFSNFQDFESFFLKIVDIQVQKISLNSRLTPRNCFL